MEDKNRELNVEELEQGAGGAGGFTGREMDEKTKALMRQYKRSGRTKEEFIQGQGYLRRLADRYWDEV